MSINSNQKGKRAERMLASKFREYGFNARRSQQYAGINSDADVVGLPGIHIECKFVERLNLYDAMAQSKRDARSNEMPCVFHKRSRSEWLVTMRFDDWMTLYGESDHLSRVEARTSLLKPVPDKIPVQRVKSCSAGDKGAEA